MTSFAFPFGLFPHQQQQLHSHSKNDYMDDESPASLSRSPSSSSIEGYPLDSESSTTNLRQVYKTDSVVSLPPPLPLPFATSSTSENAICSNSTSPSGSPVHPSSVQVKRKRGRPPKPKTPAQLLEELAGHESSSSQDGVSALPPQSPPKRKRGRPPGKKKKAEHEFLYYVDESTGTVTPAKSDLEDKDYSDDASPKQQSQNPFGFNLANLTSLTPQPPQKRGRGRPRKYPLPGQNLQTKPLSLNASLNSSTGSIEWDSLEQDSLSFSFEPPSDYAIVDYLRSIVNEQSKTFLGFGEVRGLLECHFGMDLQYRQYYIEESLDLLCPYS
eukprot:CAMPEP_0168563362 /NCGR_PEP_ID=MMETSP0413-20121227/12637_1 /TAXON_ID=136452 /ORGANISM="Filamoeba nolandi, Strain NC-AS-23-1" /LENGTH=327 /DNA_ID=CAMNT_0008594893 /DNA_START=411 /DNA_END=1394 /DNA_ORIENTATION=+